MDSMNDAAVAFTVDAVGATAAEEPAAHEDGKRWALLLDRLRGAVRPAAQCALVAFHFALSAYDVRREPRRRLLLAALAFAYAAVAALMWFDWRMEAPRLLPLDARERRTKLAARILASVVVNVLAYCTASPSPCGLLLFIWYHGSE